MTAKIGPHHGRRLAGFALAVGVVLAASPGVAQGELDCRGWSNKDLNQHQMNMCQQQDFDSADAQLNAAFRKLVGALETDMKAKLVAAQRAWITFRDAECTFETADSEGGSMHPLVYYGCLTRLTKLRTDALKEHAQTYANQ